MMLTGRMIRQMQSDLSRNPNGNKGDFGYATLICGSRSYRGAALMATEAALRSGVGLCCLASVEEVISAAVVRTPEAVFLPLPCREGSISAEAVPLLQQKVNGSTAVVCGPGLGDTDSVAELLGALLPAVSCPKLLDADALNVMARHRSLLSYLNADTVITPHPGEMARLMQTQISQITDHPEKSAVAFAERYGCVTLLKGHETVIASPDGEVYRNQTGNAGLAKGGSGDVLAGLIGGILARKIPAFHAACYGCYLHGRSADLCAGQFSQNGMTPTDLFPFLCRAWAELSL